RPDRARAGRARAREAFRLSPIERAVGPNRAGFLVRERRSLDAPRPRAFRSAAIAGGHESGAGAASVRAAARRSGAAARGSAQATELGSLGRYPPFRAH